jgi:hypothetical protein
MYRSALLSSLSIMAIKPALVEYALKKPGKIDITTYLEHYIEKQIYQLNVDKPIAKTILENLQEYYINVGDNFMPIILNRDGRI